jgi:ATP-dependent helicase HrpA
MNLGVVMRPITFPADLPVVERREEIAAAIATHQVVIIAGETGSGKTTQLPKICLQMGRGVAGMIGHTQPRRLAARTVAQRIADELDTQLGDLVGYQVRFHDQVSAGTAIKLMTDGILLAEIQRDRLLRRYDTIILDEAHERSLNIDFLLGYLHRILPQRPDLKLVITSATIDLASFSRHFDDAPVLEVSGRAYPVETIYLPPGEDDGDDGAAGRVADLVDEVFGGEYGPPGDILVFLPGERDIRELAKVLRRRVDVDVLPLYSRLSQSEQNRVFDVSRRRAPRVVLATNVAETSLTVPGIRYVIDPGEARVSRYSYRTKVQRLPIEPVSQASANQRKGRCGRVAEGVCLRLYSETDFLQRPEFTDPEIRRTNLAAVILQMLTLRLGAVEDFPFIDPPDPRMVRDGYKLLEELGAVNPGGQLTAVGRQMAQLPVDPKLARMVLAASSHGCLEEILVIASALTVQDPRERPPEKQTQSDQMHARFRHQRSDFMAWLALWRYYEEQRQSLSQNQLRKLCKREYLAYMRMREWRDVHYQLTIACRQQGLRPRSGLPDQENYQSVHEALLSGLLGNIAQWQEDAIYLGSRNRKLQIFPGSSQFRRKPKWLVAGEIVETSRVYAREVAAIDPRWVIGINPALLKHHYYEPRWQPRSGRVMAYERISLYGLTLADKRSVHYGPINPAESRELLIRQGLVAGRWQRPPAFLKANTRLLAELQDLESRTRRRDIVADDQVLFDFYDERLPADTYTAGRLQSWLKRDEKAAGSLLISRDLLLNRDPGELGNQFPDHLDWQDMRFQLSYQFEPGKTTDGVSVTVPVGLLNRVPRYLFDWLVPGLLREKCIQLLKSLPKEKRKKLVPVPDFVDSALAGIEPRDIDLAAALAARLTALAGITVAARDFDLDNLDDYYRMNVRVVDARGALLAQGRELNALIEQFRSDTRQSVSAGPQDSPARAGITQWDMGDIPRQWRFRQAGVDIQAWPALVDRGDTVSLELLDYASQAQLKHRLGVLRLLRLHSSPQVKYLRKQLLRGNEVNLVLAAAQLERAALVEDLIDGAYVQAMGLDRDCPYDQGDFMARLAECRADLVAVATDRETNLMNSLRLLAELRRPLLALGPDRFPDTRADIEQQLPALLGAGFQRDTPADWLAQYPRYLKALGIRLERLSGQYARDQQHTSLLLRLQAPLQQALADRSGLLLLCPAAQQYRWMLEELRVSLFAQNLGTRQAVSDKRLQEQWQAVASWLASNPH